MMDYSILPYEDSSHRKQVISLWESVFGYADARNEPSLAIDKKIAQSDGLFFAAAEGDSVIGTVMGGYDGHRGWIYSLAVAVPARGNGIGRGLMDHVERALRDRGCVKINLQILDGNREVENFYQKLGYATEPRISMGKCLFDPDD